MSSGAAFPSYHGSAGDPSDVYAYDAVELALQAIAYAHGDLSHGERRLMAAMRQVRCRHAHRPAHARPHQRAVAPNFLIRVRRDGKLVPAAVGVIPKVEKTFGGYFSPTSPPDSRDTACLPAGAMYPPGPADQTLIDQVKRVRLSAGASPPGRIPAAGEQHGRPGVCGERSDLSEPVPLPAVGEPDDDEARRRRPATRPSAPGSTSSGSAVTPNARWIASDALASSRLASRSASFGPASRSGTSSAPASQAPISIAVQSCSPPPNGTSTGPAARACPPDQHTDVARRRAEHARVSRILQQRAPARREEQVDVLLGREPDGILGASRT